MSRALTSGELKALVRQLVSACGGVEATALELGISHQRVSQLQSPNCTDQMTFLQIAKLECICERAIVSGAQVRAVEGVVANVIGMAAVEAVTRTAATLRLVTDMDADGARDLGEIGDVRKAAQDNLRAAEQLADAAASLQPGRAGL